MSFAMMREQQSGQHEIVYRIMHYANLPYVFHHSEP